MIPLSIDQVTKQYPDGTQAVKGVSFNIKPGEGTILLGSNGSGKTTLLRCINGLESATTGNIYVDDIDVVAAKKKKDHRKIKRVRQQVGMVFQRFELISNLGVLQNVLFGSLGRIRKPWEMFATTASKEERDRAMECLDRVGLSDYAGQRARSLSGGQQQRVGIARMLLQEPQIVLADEPIASLDPKSGREVMDLLWEIVRERNLTVVCALHQLAIAQEYGDRLIGMRHGHLVMDSAEKSVSTEELNQLYDDDKEEEATATVAAEMTS